MAASEFPSKCVCGCGRRLPRLAVQHNDPFASARCCKLAHGLKAEDDAAVAASILSRRLNLARRRSGQKQAFDYAISTMSMDFEGTDADDRRLFTEV